MQHCTQSPYAHGSRDPQSHAISAAQSCTDWLEGDEEGEEDGDGSVEVIAVQAYIRGEVGSLSVAYLWRVNFEAGIGRMGSFGGQKARPRTERGFSS